MYVPMQPQIFFTRNNRDPKLIVDNDDETAFPKQESDDYNLYILNRTDLKLEPKNPAMRSIDLKGTFEKPDWDIVTLTCDFPYMFLTYKHKFTGEYYSGFYRGIESGTAEWIEYNPFAYTGRNSNVEYLQCKWNDKTGLGVTVMDNNEEYDFTMIDGRIVKRFRIKELGWTPDTLLIYPAPEMYRYLVAKLADKFAALNESQSMGVGKELVEAQYAFDNFINKDKSSWQRIDNVNGLRLSDYIW